MYQPDTLIIIFVLACIGGAAGARVAGVIAWKGAAIVATSMTITLLIFVLTGTDNHFLSVAVSMGASAIIGTMLKLAARETAAVILGSILVTLLADAPVLPR
ncbi:hypothetical protein [Rhizobium sp. AG207R]|uniref:hypothetical protein n=1 Tax=Rhizobium sp. AG207R TaxID=2802287 RepID=UPI0022AC598B|nr:hypothetical protein [Rhizobium sp. AG207R]MCZ3378437.1 hypothetical protein [Rhizobium sp. AG207R]